MTELEPITPREALDLYLDDRRADVTGSTLRSHRYRLEPFVQWCHENDVDNLNEVTGRDLHQYKTWRQNSGGLNAVTLRTQLSTLRVFLKFCRSIDGVAEKLPEQVAVPTVPKGERERDEMHVQITGAAEPEELDLSVSETDDEDVAELKSAIAELRGG